MGVHATTVTASQSMPAGQLSMHQWSAIATVVCTPFRVHSTFRTCLISIMIRRCVNCVNVQNGLVGLDEVADRAVTESADSRMLRLPAAEVTSSQSADDVESCVTADAVTSTVSDQLSCQPPCLDSSFSNCDCETSSCTS